MLELAEQGVDLVTGSHPAGLVSDVDLVVLSPGVPTDVAPLKEAREAGSAHLGRVGAGFPGDRRIGGGSDRHKGQIDDRDAHRRHLEARRSAGRVGAATSGSRSSG